MTTKLFTYEGELYPDYLKHGNAMQYVLPIAQQFCQGRGVDVGGGKWPLPGAVVVDQGPGYEHSTPLDLPFGPPPDDTWDYVFSSHCLEHLTSPVAALEHWRNRLRPGGVVFLYLPHPDMIYWRPERCRKHLHAFWPKDVAATLRALGFTNVIHSERDLAWSFSVVGYK